MESPFVDSVVSQVLKRPVSDTVYVNQCLRGLQKKASKKKKPRKQKSKKHEHHAHCGHQTAHAVNYFAHSINPVSDVQFCERSHKFDAEIGSRRPGPYRSAQSDLMPVSETKATSSTSKKTRLAKPGKVSVGSQVRQRRGSRLCVPALLPADKQKLFKSNKQTQSTLDPLLSIETKSNSTSLQPNVASPPAPPSLSSAVLCIDSEDNKHGDENKSDPFEQAQTEYDAQFIWPTIERHEPVKPIRPKHTLLPSHFDIRPIDHARLTQSAQPVAPQPTQITTTAEEQETKQINPLQSDTLPTYHSYPTIEVTPEKPVGYNRLPVRAWESEYDDRFGDVVEAKKAEWKALLEKVAAFHENKQELHKESVAVQVKPRKSRKETSKADEYLLKLAQWPPRSEYDSEFDWPIAEDMEDEYNQQQQVCVNEAKTKETKESAPAPAAVDEVEVAIESAPKQTVAVGSQTKLKPHKAFFANDSHLATTLSTISEEPTVDDNVNQMKSFLQAHHSKTFGESEKQHSKSGGESEDLEAQLQSLNRLKDELQMRKTELQQQQNEIFASTLRKRSAATATPTRGGEKREEQEKKEKEEKIRDLSEIESVSASMSNCCCTTYSEEFRKPLLPSAWKAFLPKTEIAVDELNRTLPHFHVVKRPQTNFIAPNASKAPWKPVSEYDFQFVAPKEQRERRHNAAMMGHTL